MLQTLRFQRSDRDGFATTRGEAANEPITGVASDQPLIEPSLNREARVMRAPKSAETSMAEMNGILIRTAIVVALASVVVLPLVLN